MRFRLLCWAIAAAVFVVEVAIAKGIIPGQFVRHSLGDVLVIVLLYYFFRGFTRAASTQGMAWAFGLSLGAGFLAEGLQYFHFAERLGLARGSFLSIALGNTFSVSDLVMYVIGAFVALALDAAIVRRIARP